MQTAESEMILPLNTKPALRSSLLMAALSTVLFLGISAWLIVQATQRSNESFPWLLVMGGVVVLLAEGWLLAWAIRKRLAPSPTLRLSHEGIFFSMLIRWEDIKTLFPYHAPGAGPVVGIVVRDYEALLAHYVQAHASGWPRRFFLRWLLRFNAWLLRTIPGHLAQVNIPQRLLPCSCEALLAEIRTQFAAELQEQEITILDWQN